MSSASESIAQAIRDLGDKAEALDREWVRALDAVEAAESLTGADTEAFRALAIATDSLIRINAHDKRLQIQAVHLLTAEGNALRAEITFLQHEVQGAA